MEAIFFLGPALDASIEAWRPFTIWDLERRDDGTVIAVHPNRWYSQQKDDYESMYRSKAEMTLPAFKTAAQAAHTSRLADYDGRIDEAEDLPQLVTNANNLHAFHVETGNVNHPDGPPETNLPPACGLAVPDQLANRGLLRNCKVLLGLKDELRGTAALNWSVDVAMADWDGVTTGGTPSRVRKLELADKSLTGTIPAELGSLTGLKHLDLSDNSLTEGIPAELGSLTGLKHLDLSDNSLTGGIPAELGLLHNLVSVKLSGNSLTGCIPPVAAGTCATNDLDDLGLPDCVE